MWESFFAPERVFDIASAIAAGAAGGVVRSMALKSGWRQLLSNVVVGGILAVYVGPFASEIIAHPLGIVNAQEMAPQLGPFLCGVLGMMLVEFFMGVLNRRKKELERGNE